MFSHLAAAALLVLPLSQAASLASRHDDHDHTASHALPDAWYHADDHPAHALFRRQSEPTDGVTYPTVGSAQWAKAYPSGTPNVKELPQAWVDALNKAVAAGQIPNISVSTVDSEGFTHYAGGGNPNGKEICSTTYQCKIPGDIWDAPNGTLACGFDDGPLPPSPKLYEFLKANDQKATHFFIGSNILQYPKEFMQAFETNQDDIAVHTWTHPYMTTRTNLEVLAELGWTMQIIHNSTGGRLPKFWRPPYGDSDTRVQAIASKIFGLTTIIWNQDTNDWALPGGTTVSKIEADLKKWLTGKKSPGLIILEHELSTESVQAFITAYPLMKSNGWNITSAARLAGAQPWQNAADANSPVTPANGIIVGSINSSLAPNGTSTATGTASGSSSTGSSGGSSSKNSANARSTMSSWAAAGVLALAVLPFFA